jgi:hypothetical protein
MSNAFVYEEGIGGICSWEDYPYVGHRHWVKGCEKRKCSPEPFSDVSGFVNVTQTDVGLMEALLIQPVSVAVDAAAVGVSFLSRTVCCIKGFPSPHIRLLPCCCFSPAFDFISQVLWMTLIVMKS